MGNFGTVPRGTYGKLCPKPLPVLTPRVHMGPIGEAAVPRRSAEPPPPRSPKDVPNDLSLRSLIPCSRFSASLASFSSCTLSNSACVASFSLFIVSFFRCTFSRSALKAATSSDTDITLWLACCPTPSALSQLYSPPLFRSPMATVPAIPHSLSPFPHGPSLNVCTPPSRLTKCVRRPFWPD